MPEGPEIRRTADALGRAFAGKPLTRTEYRVPRLARKARQLRGARIERVYSRAKAVLIEYDRGITHYRHNQLFGEWEISRGMPAADERRAARVVLATATHTAILYSATEIELLGTRDVERHPYIARLGRDALDATTTVALVRVGGLGNYLRSDILFAAGLSGNARPRDLDAAQVTRIASAILRITRRSYRHRGITNDPVQARAARRNGASHEESRFLTYGRAGEPCSTCGTTIVRDEAGNRGLFRCPVCQPSLR